MMELLVGAAVGRVRVAEALGAQLERGQRGREEELEKKGNLIFLFYYNNNKDQLSPKLIVPTIEFAPHSNRTSITKRFHKIQTTKVRRLINVEAIHPRY